MFRMLIHPSKGVCDLFVELFHGLYCSVRTTHVTTKHSPLNKYATLQSNTTHEITQQISRKLLRVDVLTSETCWALNNEIIKQVTSSWSLFIQQITRILFKRVLGLKSAVLVFFFIFFSNKNISSLSHLTCIKVCFSLSRYTRCQFFLFVFFAAKISFGGCHCCQLR